MLRLRSRTSGRRSKSLLPETETMSVKSDRWIRRMAEEHQLIQPFEAALVREAGGRRIISAGASSYGYDMRLADDGFRVFSPIHSREIDPKNFDEESLVEAPLRDADDGSRYYLMPPHSYALGVTVETFRMPRNVTGICMCKSTYARFSKPNLSPADCVCG
jgi:dCTP deaminase